MGAYKRTLLACLATLALLTALVHWLQVPKPLPDAFVRPSALAADLRDRSDLGAPDTPVVPAPLRASRPVALRALDLDLSTPAHPLPMKLLQPAWNGEQERDLIALGDIAYALGRYGEFQMVHLGDPFENPLPTWDPSVAVVDQCLYVVAGDDGLRVVDRAAETSTLLLTPGTALAILVREHYAYVALLQYPPAYSGYD